jgi:aspartate aminotransferase
MLLAQRTTQFAGSGTAAARAAAKAAAASGKEIIDLTAGEIWSDLAPTLRSGAIAAVESGVSRYTDTIGLEPLRQAIARKLSTDTGHVWSADEVAVTSGAKQALFNAAMVLLNPGDEVIIPAPYWTTFPAQVVIAGATPIYVDTRGNGYVPRPQDIEALINEKTRAIILNTPSNPTGAVYDEATLRAIANLAIAHRIWIIFDECYGAFAHEPRVHRNIVSVAPEIRGRAVIVNAFSKQLAITGWRLGYLAAPREVIGAVKALQSHTTSNPNVIAQHAVLEHLEKTDGAFERQLRAQLSAARALGLALLSNLKNVPPPLAQGGFYFYLDLSNLAAGRTADDIVNRLLAEGGVAAVSGSAFGDPHGLRLSYGIPLERLDVGLRRLVESLNALT